ncbi:MAG: restriction endonuclease [Chloroflexota bacterium]
MSIPDFQTIMLPLLQLAADGKEHTIRDAQAELAVELNLSEEEKAQLIPSGRQPVFYNRVSWAKAYLQQAGLLTSPRKGTFLISQRGREVLASKPDRITIKFLERFPEFVESRSYSRKEKSRPAEQEATNEDHKTPEESLEDAYQKIRGGLAAELLHYVKNGSPQFFERLVVELLVKMGYGGSRKEAGEAIGHSGDEGIDGIINEDRLGLDVIYIQAKKWAGTVGRPEIQGFVGALHGKRARKGVFITTGVFSKEAIEYVSRIDPKVVLIDGRQLADLMIDFGLGVAPIASYEIKRVDTDYFEQG